MFVVHFLELCVVLFEKMTLFIVCSICSSCYSHVNLAFHTQSTQRQLCKHINILNIKYFKNYLKYLLEILQSDCFHQNAQFLTHFVFL